jgi:hypothetical protein
MAESSWCSREVPAARYTVSILEGGGLRGGLVRVLPEVRKGCDGLLPPPPLCDRGPGLSMADSSVPDSYVQHLHTEFGSFLKP